MEAQTESIEETGGPEALPTIEDLIAERDGLVDALQRSVAEFQNYRRRVDSERLRLRELATQDVITSLLPLLDDLQRALSVIPKEDRETGLGAGISAIERKFVALLERNGVRPVGAIGDKFDPAVHEAVATDDSGVQTHINEVFQTGYRQGDTVIRPAVVKVGKETEFNA